MYNMYVYLDKTYPNFSSAVVKFPKYRLCILETMILVLFCPSLLLFGWALSDESM